MHEAAACQIKAELKHGKKETWILLEEAQQEYDSKFTLILVSFISFIYLILSPYTQSSYSLYNASFFFSFLELPLEKNSMT